MPTAKGEISWSAVHDAAQYKKLARQLKEAGRGDLQRRMTREIRREGAVMLRAVQAAWLTVQVRGEGGTATGGRRQSTGLRRRAAAATRISILGSGIRLQVAGNKIDPAYGRSLSRSLDGLGRWRFPVHGNREVWVQNHVEGEVFYTTARRFEARFRAGVQRVMDDTARRLSS